MKIAFITLFPEMFEAVTAYGISGRAVKNGLVEVASFNPRDFTEDRHQTVDDRPYGGGPGMVMLIEPLRRAIAEAKQWMGGPALVIYLSPQGKVLDQQAVNQFAEQQNLVLIAGRYEGIDERLVELEIDEEWSIGDYVLSGGELPAMVLLDALIRKIPGALGHQDSADQDSFAQGLLDCPHFTRPEFYEGERVPEVLLSGDHEKIRRWRLQQSLVRTQQRRPELLDRLELTKEQQALLKEVSAALTDDGKG
ncbi:MAG: tRNA (guanosine(37)-N1)-methyltransferase TrmD [Proteobacteria bacterium]|jgi:tRNA (guanine37-N1)-methyltransferase|uniref:tRNA (guanine-N(1)-)-methyltransferase n=1 Tax=SAR92 bacterium BACL26 MAG-121220-bin70 TaxID=1655626 RepID=A0A0R2UAN3_9GAMM|nr:MAG: tRNA (guanine-N1)-methyltransferase [SAR92 bacterium BACL26 MAG-121220-bin70]MDA0795359.1 tRNA (guanosine(37)-N1)-methyltransferase TrmD [Pseudomonadota bacterium]MDA1351501.1 tRNA (guanosine(37)-N1)-methyltransferase TrmD [Pseudomonadota bacterium]|tara:strand:- start:6289 stop:7041 length:753 start_codon:yes stop_codon:yes gene_type:complete